jgi:DNA invertase Pin-like site-specific DNA recombinase
MKQTKVAIYSRVSGSGQNAEMQIRELQAYCRTRGWKIAGEYSDRTSGALDSRPELNRLMADADRRRFDVVVVWKFDRFARSVSHLLRALETFRALGIEFLSLRKTSRPVHQPGKWCSRCSVLSPSWSGPLSAKE